MLRAFRLLLSVWFLVVLVEPEAVHSCAVHASPVSAGEDHSAHGGSVHQTGDDGSYSSAVCSCPDDCAAGSAALQLSRIERHVAVAIVEAETTQPTTQVVSLAIPPPFLLPFANGPPSVPA
jgi:hypothetical protein